MRECSHGLPALSHHAECYAGLKDKLRAGEHLSEDELTYIGFGASTRAPDAGWRDASGCSTFELTEWEVAAEDAAVIAWLMGAGARRDGIGFLSGG